MINARNFARPVAFVVAVLAASLALRLVIVVRGGSYYWADEKRYEPARAAVAAVLRGDLSTAAGELLSTSGHIGFRWLALIPAAAERLVTGEARDPRWCSGFFALFSVANLLLVWCIARRVAPTEREAALALAIAACSNALFFYSRHCFPYDASLTFLLFAVYLSVGPSTKATSWLVGACGGIGYLVYNGYWSVGAVVLAFHVLDGRASIGQRLRRGVLAGGGLLLPIVAAFGVARLAGHDLVADSVLFAGTVNQGDFGEGWRFVGEYLWVADGPLWIVMGALILAGLARCVARGEAAHWLRWVALVAALGALWIVFCDLVPKFVLYGRTVRAAVPFLALAAAGAIEQLRRSAPRPAALLVSGAALAACAGGLAMMAAPLRQVFPREFRRMAERVSTELRQRDPAAVLETRFAEYRAGPEPPAPPPPHRELLRRPHPHQYRPYLYEGYTRAQRPFYHAADIAMRLIQLDPRRGLHLLKRAAPPDSLAPFSGPLFLRVSLARDAPGRSETLLTAGDAPERQSRVLIDYVDAAQVRLGFAVPGAPARFSAPIPCDYGSEHTIAVSLGAFFPPGWAASAGGRADGEALARRAILAFDGQTVLSAGAEFSAAPLEQITLGAATGSFSGQVHSAREIDPRWLAGASQPARPVRISGPLFGEHHGALELLVRFPPAAAGGAEPILATGRPGAGDVVFVSHLGDGRVRFHVDHWGAPALGSAVLRVSPGAVHRLVVSLGSLYPLEDDARFERSPHLRKLTRWLYVALDGAVVFSRPFAPYPGDPVAVWLGANLPGGTACAPLFTGEILAARRVPAEEVRVRADAAETR